MDSAAGGMVDPALIIPLIPSTAAGVDAKAASLPPLPVPLPPPSSATAAGTMDAKDYKGPSAKPVPVPPSAATAVIAPTTSTNNNVVAPAKRVRRPRIGGQLLTAADKDPSKLTSFGMRSSAALQTGGVLSKLFGANAERKRRGSTSSDDNDSKVTPPQVFTGATVRVGVLGEVDNEIRVIASLNGGVAGPPPQPQPVQPQQPQSSAAAVVPPIVPASGTSSSTVSGVGRGSGLASGPNSTATATTNDNKTNNATTAATPAGLPATVTTGAGRGAPAAPSSQSQQQAANGPAAAPATPVLSAASTAAAAAAGNAANGAGGRRESIPPPLTSQQQAAAAAARADKQYWMSDKNCKECFDCNLPFTIFRRKQYYTHHHIPS